MPVVDLATSPLRELNQALHQQGPGTNETLWEVVNPRGSHAVAVRPNQDDVSVMVRPDHLRLRAPADTTPRLKGTVRGLTYLGEYTQVAIETAWGTPLSLRLSPDETARGAIAPGRNVDLTCKAADMRVF